MANRLQVRSLVSENPLRSDSPFFPKDRSPVPPKVAYFSSSPGGNFTYEKWQMWRGIAEAAREWGTSLVYISGEEFENSPQAVLYELVGKHNVDGIIFWNSFFSPRSTVEKTQEFIDRYAPLPVVSIELALKGSCNLMIDNFQ